MSKSILEAVNLKKKFGKTTALDGIDLTLGEGEVFGFIGPNGAGKTTTIRILLGIIKATEGNARMFGKDVWKDAVEIHKRLAYVPGDVNLWPNLTGGEVIDLFVSLRGVPVDKKRREDLIQKYEFDPSKKCRTYSKGNRQKVALIAAFASNADLYILDEPTSGLDPLMEQVFVACVEEQKAAGKTIFLSSHILSEVERLCCKVGIIRQGKIIQTGTLSELRHLTRVNIYIETRLPAVGLETIGGIYNILKKENGISFQADSAAVENIINNIAKFGVTKIESAPMALEDLFMRHYAATGGTI